jgi:hypothetical protein
VVRSSGQPQRVGNAVEVHVIGSVHFRYTRYDD